jgi:hypothetical protein
VVSHGTRLGCKHWSVVHLLILLHLFLMFTLQLPTSILTYVYYYYSISSPSSVSLGNIIHKHSRYFKKVKLTMYIT